MTELPELADTSRVDPSGSWFQVDLQQDAPIALDVHFGCGQDEILALVGPSGGGKTTILKTIAGLYRPRHGQIRVGDQQWLDTSRRFVLPVRRRSVGVVFQDYALFPHLSALANVAEAMQHIPTAERRERAARLLARVHLSGLEERRPAQLSGGQQQRVAVARALARDPEVLLLDEPFSAVDQVTREKLYEELAILHQQLRLPIVLVTHSLQEAAMLADRMCILHRGKSLQLDRPEVILNQPASVDVARLVALRNVFSGRVAGQEHGLSTRIEWGGVILDAPYDARLRPGQSVHWMIPDSRVVMHRLDKTYRATGDNVLHGQVLSVLALGNTTHIRMQPAGNDRESISFTVPTHFARLNRAASGGRIEVSLEKEAIHLLPA